MLYNNGSEFRVAYLGYKVSGMVRTSGHGLAECNISFNYLHPFGFHHSSLESSFLLSIAQSYKFCITKLVSNVNDHAHLSVSLSDKEGRHLRVPRLLTGVGAPHHGHHAQRVLLNTPQLNVLIVLRIMRQLNF